MKRKVTTAKSKHAVAEFQCLKEEFLQGVVMTVEMEEIPSDKTGIKTRIKVGIQSK